MSRIAGLLSLTFADSQSDIELLAGIAARQQHHRSARATIECHGPLAAAIVAPPQGDECGIGPHRAHDPARQLFVLAEGTLFNRDELERILRASGSLVRRSPSPADLALAAYHEWGDGSFPRLSGIFAIVVFDGRQGKCLLVRDQFGAKPLHYAVIGDRLVFASEAGALLAPGNGARINRRAMLEFSLHGNVMPPETLFEGISAVPPGHYLVAERGSGPPQLRQYHDAFDAVSEEEHERLRQDGPERFLNELDGNLHRSIRENMADGGPHGIALSGGVDSAVLTAIAARYGPVHPINISVPEGRGLDERAMAEAVAKHVGVPLSVVTMSGELYRRELVSATRASETPLWHVQSLGYYLASRRASELGLRSVLCGDTIGMMLSPASMLPWRKLQPLLGAAGLAPPGLGRFVQKLGNALAGLPLNSQGFSWASPMTTQLIDGYARAELQRRSEAVYSFVSNAERRRIQGGRLADVYMLFSYFYHRGDRLGQAWNVEYRTPFGDLSALRLAMNLPFEYLMRKGISKWSIKQLGQRYIPRHIAFQKKVAWNMPRDIYFRPLAAPQFFDDGFCAWMFGLTRKVIDARMDSWLRDAFQLARLVHMEVWGRLFIMGETPDQLNAWLATFEAPRSG